MMASVILSLITPLTVASVVSVAVIAVSGPAPAPAPARTRCKNEKIEQRCNVPVESAL